MPCGTTTCADAPCGKARSIAASAGIAAAALWLPAALPLTGIGPLTECSHCVRIYLMFLPVEPGVFLGIVGTRLLGLDVQSDAVLLTLCGLAAAGELAGITWAHLRLRAGWPRWALCAVTAALATPQALGFAAALRM